MTALIIIGSILLFLAVLLFSPVVLRFAYRDGKVSAKVRYLAVIVDLSPDGLAKRSGKKAERVAKKKKPGKEKEAVREENKKTVKETLETVRPLLKTSKRGMNILRKHFVFYSIRTLVAVGGGDAHETAMNYAKYCALVANGLAALDAIFVVKEPDIFIAPDFTREETCWDIAFRVRISPWYALAAGRHVLASVLKASKKDNPKHEKIKGGKRHEPTACY